MKEKILPAIQEAIKANEILSLSDKTIGSFAQVLSEKITDETLIAQTVQEYLPLLKEMQANINNVVADSVKKKESALKEEHEKEIEGLKKSTGNNPSTSQDIRQVIEAYAKEIVEPLAKQLQTLQGNEIQNQLAIKLSESLAQHKIPSWYYTPAIEDRTFKDESEVNNFVTNLNTKWETTRQELANQGFKGVVPPASSNEQQKSDTEALVATIHKGTKEKVEQNKK